MDNLILIDTSYVSFYRFYAIIKWLSMAHGKEYKDHINNPNYNWLDDKLFLEKYEKMYFESIKKILGKQIFSNSQIIFCMDTPRENIWRTQISTNYKSDRIDLSKKNNFKPIFKYTYSHIIPNILKHKNIKLLKIDELEADDLIGIIIKYYEENDINKKIYLISGDNDFLQLGRPNLFFVNFKNKKKFIELNQEEAKLLLHKKILLGDKSDCISSIFPPKFSLQKKKEITNSIENFNVWLEKNKEYKMKYDINTKLIDFNYIPEKFKIKVINEFTKLF